MEKLHGEIRTAPVPEDLKSVTALLEATGFFYSAEIDIARELVQETLDKGDAGDYRFIFLDGPEGLRGYSCYGVIPLTRSSYDLYWIAVRRDLQGKGAGRALLAMTEDEVRRNGGERIYADTSSREQYRSTREFYLANGYIAAADFEDFYAPGDGKIVFMKKLVP